MAYSIIYYYFDEPTHLNSLIKTNSEHQIIPLNIKNDLPTEIAWRNPDRILRESLIKHNVFDSIIHDNILLIEWDVYVNDLIENMEFDYMISKYFHPSKEEKKWIWWNEINRLPEEFIQYAAGCALFGFIGINKNVLLKMLDTKYDYIFNLDIFCELRFATVVKSMGYDGNIIPSHICKNITTVNDEDRIRKTLIKNSNERGIFHPVKYHISKIKSI